MNNPFSSGGAVRQLLERVPRISRKTIYMIGAGVGGLAMATYLLYQYSLPTPPPPEPNVNPSKNENWFKSVQVKPPAPRVAELPPPPEVAPPPPEVKPANNNAPVAEDPLQARLQEMALEARFEQPLLNLAFPNTAQNNEPGNNTEADKAEKKIELTEIKRPRTPFEIKTGTVIPAVLMTGINSDLPGMIIATVRENVYDSVTGSHLLIPQGAKLIGQYESDIRMGQNRVMIGFNKMQLPDGGTIDLQGIPASDPAGYAGFADQVDNHFWKIFGQSLLWAIINAGAQMGQNQGEYTFSNEDYGSQAQDELSASMQETADAILRRNLNISPTLKIRPGYRFNVMVVNDLVFSGTYDGKF